MKKARITKVEKPQPDSIYTAHKMYSVYLAPGQSVRLKTKKETQAHLRNCTRQLQLAVCELNQIYCQVFCLYREAWNYSSQPRYAQQLAPVQQILVRMLAMFDRATDAPRLYTGNGGPMRAAYDICEDLQHCCQVLAKVFAARTIYHSGHICQAHGRRVGEIEKALAGL